MKEEEVEALLEAMKDMTKRNEWLLFCPKYRMFAETIAELTKKFFVNFAYIPTLVLIIR